MEIVGAILDIAGHHHQVFFIPFPIEWVWDVNWVVMVAFRVIDDEPDWRVVSIIGFFCDPVEVNGAEGDAECIILWEWG